MIRPLTLALIVVAGIAALQAQDWAQWRGPSRSGLTEAFTAPAVWPDRPKKVWEATVGTGHSSPVVAAGRAFALSRLGEDEAVTAFDVQSGRQLWQQRYPAPYQINPAAESHGKGPKSTPAVGGSRVVTLGISGTLSAFDAATGKPLWRKAFSGEFDASSPDFGAAMSPLIDAGLVIAHVGGNRSGALSAFDAATGAVRWQWKGDGPGYASPVIGTFAGTRQIITQSRSHLVGVSAADGRLLWQVPFATAYSQNIVTPVVVEDLVISSGIEQPLTAVRVALANGQWSAREAWRAESVPMYMSSAVVSGGHLYGLTHRNKGQFFCAEPKTGKVLWITRGREAENAALIASGDLLIATTTEGELVVARRDPAKFQLIRRYTVAESPIWAHPAPAGRGLLIKDAEKVAYWVF
jgi:outer membrane protein assembly factor BamB